LQKYFCDRKCELFKLLFRYTLGAGILFYGLTHLGRQLIDYPFERRREISERKEE